ncbi:YggT family protein [Nocardia camponoti]|uniref:Membrane protein n=1 Tax=Nocardia camponoti TaxID=1616106 RepID=A0A917QS54_9NOCA|nr:YggT family protein [Nocardia camponoti]GGK65945.1 membrane protein [Nocardia camponoti]
MAPLFAVLYVVILVFWLLLIGRVLVELIRSFARDWRPKGFVVVILEVIFTVTDPPVKLLRRVIPPLRLGGVSLDLSIMVLVILLGILMQVVGSLGSSVTSV